MKASCFLVILFLRIGCIDYTKEQSWQQRKKYAKKVIGFFIYHK